MVNRKVLLAPTTLFVVLATALTFAINPVADAASKKTLKLLWSDEFNGKKGTLPSTKTWTREIGGGGWGSQNEFPFLRIADIHLMKAEAILRGGTATGGQTPLSIVNGLRSKRNASVLGSVNLTELLKERGRELYLEGWRRNDMVRFGVFNDPVQERSVRSDAYKVVYPIPTISLSSNPNLKQNIIASCQLSAIISRKL